MAGLWGLSSPYERCILWRRMAKWRLRAQCLSTWSNEDQWLVGGLEADQTTRKYTLVQFYPQISLASKEAYYSVWRYTSLAHDHRDDTTSVITESYSRSTPAQFLDDKAIDFSMLVSKCSPQRTYTGRLWLDVDAEKIGRKHCR